MSLLVQRKGFLFVGKVKDIINLFAAYPPELTLQEYINLKLN